LPEGFVNQGELVHEAASRELMEETGLSLFLSEADFISYYDALKRDPRKRIITFTFGKLISGEFEIQPNDDAKEVDWFCIEKLPQLAFDTNLTIKCR